MKKNNKETSGFSIVVKNFNKLFDKNRNLNLKTFNSEMIAVVAFCVFNLIFNVFFRFDLYYVIIHLVFLLILLKFVEKVNKTKSFKNYNILICLIINFIFIPILYILGGGMNNCVYYYFLLGIIVTFVLIKSDDKKFLYLLFEILLYFALFMYSYFYENIEFNDMSFYLNNLNSIVFFGISISCSLLFVIRENEKQRKRLEKMNYYLKKKAIVDALTGVWNRKYMEEKLEEEMTKDQNLSIAMFDIDHFKAVNDNYGHQEGDEILKRFTDIINECLRDEDVITRYGGEEFLVIFPATTISTAYRISEKIRKKVMVKLIVEQDNKQITVSGGVATYHKGESLFDFIERADQNLYYAKEHGRNQICIKS